MPRYIQFNVTHFHNKVCSLFINFETVINKTMVYGVDVL